MTGPVLISPNRHRLGSTPTRRAALAIAALLAWSCQFDPEVSGETEQRTITVMTSGGFAAAYNLLAPQFESVTGFRLQASYGPWVGQASHSIPMRLARGEAADLVILSKPSLKNLAERGDVVEGSQVDLADSSIGMAVKSGAPKPNIATSKSLVSTLLAAESIGYSGSLSGN